MSSLIRPDLNVKSSSIASNEIRKTKFVAVVGCTASGKTSLAIELASRMNGEIISCDSMQIYRKMDIGTAKPNKEEQKKVAHHMIDIVEPEEEYSCADYVSDAKKVMDDILNRGKLPVFCGGTGLYLDRFLCGGNDDRAISDPKLREELYVYYNENGADALYDILVQLDPEGAKAIHKNNVKRVIRAIEICRLTGMKKSQVDMCNSQILPEYDPTVIFMYYSNREILYRRIDERVDMMIAMGLVEEAEKLYKDGVFEKSKTASQAIGYKEILPYIRKEKTLDECVEDLKRATRRYAKRQQTWFSGKEYAQKVQVDDGEKLKTFEEIVNFSQKLFYNL